MPQSDPIIVFNRETQSEETEVVYGEGFLKWAYESPLGKAALHSFVKRPFFSKWYGARMSQQKSAERIEPFIHDFSLDPSEFEKTISEFQSFNEFFYRSLKPSARPIAPAADAIVFPADGRHLGFQHASQISGVFVKGQRFDLPELLQDDELAHRYKDGPLILSRLCPVDYHRFHFPCSGTPSETKLLNGPLFSVSPIALRKNLSYLWQNKRTLTKLQTENCGTILILEIGATCVGSIHQTFTPEAHVKKGQEKGYFAFGGSSTLLLFEPDTVTLAPDLLEHSAKCQELLAKMGTQMAVVSPRN